MKSWEDLFAFNFKHLCAFILCVLRDFYCEGAVVP